MILVEGPDGAGKTTLAKQIAAEFDIEYRRPPAAALSSTDGPSEKLIDWWQGQLEDKTLRVHDRTMYLSDVIYATVVGDRTPLCSTLEYLQGMNVLQTSWLTIFCLPDFKTIYDNVEAARKEGRHLKGLDGVKVYNHWYLYQTMAYLWAQGAHPENVYVYNYPIEDGEGIFEWLNDRVDEVGRA